MRAIRVNGRKIAWLAGFALAAGAMPSSAQVLLHGAGATFPAPIYERWSSEFGDAMGVRLEYDPVGSGAGVERISRHAVDFGGSDAPLAAAELDRLGLLQLPSVVGGVVPIVHIDGIRGADVKLTGAVLAKIYLGEIRKWNDPAIVELNPGLSLPRTRITVVHRSDSSGTTKLWTAYLSTASARWQSTVGASMLPAWPLGEGAAGNEGVASYVERTRFSIGYVEYVFAQRHGLEATQLRNRAGRFVSAGPAAFRSALAGAAWGDDGAMHQVDPDPPGPASWPVTGASYLLVPRLAPDARRACAMVGFFRKALLDGGASARDLGYEPLPGVVAERSLARLRQVLESAQGGHVPCPGVLHAKD